MDAEINILFIMIAGTGLAVYLISTILIQEFHKKRNDKTPGIILINFVIFKYVKRYKMITKGETRHIGLLYYLWIISISVVLISVVLLFLINVVIMGQD